MTYKNINFDDSAVMRSLEKIAIKKGLAKPEEIKKEASEAMLRSASSKPALNLTPSKDLSENIMKLCSGLRSKGFTKQADEIESKYVNFKSAETSLYNMMKEKGEDMVDAAHPDGSHVLQNMDGDSIVENVLDQAKKIREIAAKNPKGKLANADAINMVKITLAQTGIDLDPAAEIALNARRMKGVTDVANVAQKGSKLFPSVSRVAPAATGFLGQEVGVATFTGGAGAGTTVAASAAVLGAAVAGALVGKFLGDWYMERFQNSNLAEIFTNITDSVKIASEIADSKDQNLLDNRFAKYYYRFQESHKKVMQDASTIGALVSNKSVDKASLSVIDKFYDNLTTAGFNCSQLSSMVFSIRDDMSSWLHPINTNKYQNVILYCKNYMEVIEGMASSFRSILNDLKTALAAKEAEVQKVEQAKNPATVSGAVEQYNAQVDDAIADLATYHIDITHSKLTQEEKTRAFKWIQEQVNELSGLKQSLSKLPANRQEQWVTGKGKEYLSQSVAQSNQFKTNWID